MPKLTPERIIDAAAVSGYRAASVASGAGAVGAHVLATTEALGAQHFVSGLTPGMVLRALGPATAAFAQLQHSDLGGVGANDHHAQSHVLATTSGLGADHTVSGLTAGQVLRASGAAAAAFAQLQHSDLGGVSANQHHSQVHSITGGDHTLTAAAWQVVGATATNTLGLLTASSDPGANARLVATDASGYTRLKRLGINTASPIYDIDVNGSIRATDDIYADDALTVGGNLTVATVLRVNTAGTRVGINRDADSQFDLDVAGAIRGQYLVGRHAIQLTAAVAVCHFDGPGPANLDYSGSTHSHLGTEASTIAGGVIYRPGKFGKALQIAGATTNRVLNPSAETTGNYAALGSATCTIITTAALYGGSAFNVATTAAANDGISLTLSALTNAAHTVTFFAASNLATLQVSLDNTNWHTATPVAANVTGWWRYVAANVPAAQANGSTTLRVRQTDATARTIVVDGVQVEALTYATPYCDASLGTGHTWSGTAHASSSSRTGATVRYTVANFLNGDEGTIMLWVRHEANHGNNLGFFGSGANAQFDACVNGANTAILFRQAAITLTASGAVTMGAWHHVTFTWSKSANVRAIYRNGVLAASRQFDSGATLGSTLYVGSLASGSASGVNGLADEFVLLDYAADAKLIRAIYESDAPVFVESSVQFYRSPSPAPIWVDEYGLWAQSATGNAILGVYAGDPRRVATSRSWGGINLEDNDVLIGRSGAGYVHWDDSTQTLNVAGTITAQAGSITGALTVGASGSLTAGGGKIVVDNVGVSAAVTTAWNESAAYRFINGSTLIGGLYGYADANLTHIAVSANALPSSIAPYQDKSGYLDLTAVARGSGTQAAITLSAGNYNNSLSGYKAAVLTLLAAAGGSVATTARLTANVLYYNDYTTDYTIWHAGNDGALSGLDADSVDGQHAAAFAAASHSHAISDVTGLQTALDGKALASHTHAFGDITGNGDVSTTGKASISWLRLGEIGTAPGTGDLADNGTQAGLFLKDDKVYLAFRNSTGNLRYYYLDVTQTPSIGAAVNWIYAGVSL